jgi:hypothetical protein
MSSSLLGGVRPSLSLSIRNPMWINGRAVSPSLPNGGATVLSSSRRDGPTADSDDRIKQTARFFFSSSFLALSESKLDQSFLLFLMVLYF